MVEQIVLTSIAIFLLTISVKSIFSLLLRYKANYEKAKLRNIKIQNED